MTLCSKYQRRELYTHVYRSLRITITEIFKGKTEKSKLKLQNCGGGEVFWLSKAQTEKWKRPNTKCKTGEGGVLALAKPKLKKFSVFSFSFWALAKPKDPPPPPPLFSSVMLELSCFTFEHFSSPSDFPPEEFMILDPLRRLKINTYNSKE